MGIGVIFDMIFVMFSPGVVDLHFLKCYPDNA